MRYSPNLVYLVGITKRQNEDLHQPEFHAMGMRVDVILGTSL